MLTILLVQIVFYSLLFFGGLWVFFCTMFVKVTEDLTVLREMA